MWCFGQAVTVVRLDPILLQLADHDRVSSDVYSWSKLPHGSESSPNSAALLTQVSVVLGMTWLVRMCLAINLQGPTAGCAQNEKIWVLSFQVHTGKVIDTVFPNIFICILDFEGNILNMCEPLHSVFLALPLNWNHGCHCHQWSSHCPNPMVSI